MRKVRVAHIQDSGRESPEYYDYWGHDLYIEERDFPDDTNAYEIYLELPFGYDDEIAWWATNPSIDADKKWKEVANGRGKKCSLCGFRIRNKNAIPKTNSYYEYCPHCGERMRWTLDNYVELNEKEWDKPDYKVNFYDEATDEFIDRYNKVKNNV